MFLPEWLLTVQQQAAQPASPTLILSKPVFTWGTGYNGSLGLGDTVVRSSPVQIGTSSWIMVAAGYSTTVGVLSTGALFTWGSAAAGALGNGTTTGDRSSPIAIGSSSWNYVAAGAGRKYAIRSDGGLFFWGAGALGLSGLNDNTNRNSPTQIGSSSWTQVSSKNQNTSAITVDSRLFVWGQANLGLGASVATARSSPVQMVTIQTSSWTQVSTGEAGSMAIASDGLAFYWGTPLTTNASLPYMNDALVTANYPWPLRTFQTETDESNYLTATNKTGLSWLQADVSAYGGIALRSDRKIFTWGSNTDGALGINSTTGSDTRYNPQIITPQSTYNFVTSGNFGGGRFFAIGTDGILYAWGNNSIGALGVGDSTRRNVPTAVNIASSFVFVATGIQGSAGITTDGSLFTWGTASNGALGNGTTTPNSLSPAKIGNSSWYRVKCGQNYMIGITAAFKLFGWGLNNFGQIGDGTVTQRTSPVSIGSSSWIFIAAGQSQSFAIRSDNTLWSWGMNVAGSLGLGDTINRSSPVQISSPANWKWVDANNSSFNLLAGETRFDRTFGVASDNTLYAWGSLNSGIQLSLTQTLYSAPVQISASAYSSVSIGACYAVAVRTNGIQYWWGANDPNTGPTPIYAGNTLVEYSRLNFIPANYESWRFLSSGVSHSAAIRDDYKLFVWGRDDWGQLGTGSSNIFRSFPTQIGSSSWTQVACGHNTTYAIDSRNRLFTWGLGGGGEMGNNSVLGTSSPVQLGSSSWTMVSAYRSYVMALRN